MWYGRQSLLIVRLLWKAPRNKIQDPNKLQVPSSKEAPNQKLKIDSFVTKSSFPITGRISKTIMKQQIWQETLQCEGLRAPALQIMIIIGFKSGPAFRKGPANTSRHFFNLAFDILIYLELDAWFLELINPKAHLAPSTTGPSVPLAPGWLRMK